ncbi:MAG: tetratricopeptide repeat protein [Firmicutes bacterium]|nr:tetratricopeptide repeat protein [Bacillota bacterium]
MVKHNSNVVPFLRDAAYYYQKGSYYYRKNRMDKALLYFQKTIDVEPDNPVNHYNLACLLSKLGRLQEANNIFKNIVDYLDPGLTECYFLMAINYGLENEIEKACYYLSQYLHFEPEGEMAPEAYELLLTLTGDDGYYEQEDLEYIVKNNSRNRKNEDDRLGKTLQRALYTAPDELKEEIIRFYGYLGNKEAKENLLRFVRNPWVKNRLRQTALLILKNFGVKGPVKVYMDGQLREVNLAYYPVAAPYWEKKWQQVLDCAIENMRQTSSYDEGFYEDLQAIWIDYINAVYPNVPQVRKVETWAAGLEYSLARFHFLNLTQEELAREYSVSSASVAAKYKEINRALNLDYKAYRNMLLYLKEKNEEEE